EAGGRGGGGVGGGLVRACGGACCEWPFPAAAVDDLVEGVWWRRLPAGGRHRRNRLDTHGAARDRAHATAHAAGGLLALIERGYFRSSRVSSKETGSSIGSRWVNTVLFGTTVRTRSSMSSSRSCPSCTVQWPGTSTWKEMKRRAPARRVRRAW